MNNEGNTGVEKESELQALVIRLFPPEEYGEDSNVEELYNRITDLETQNAALIAALKELIPIAEDAIKFAGFLPQFTDAECEQYETENKSAIERAKTLTEPQPKNL